MIGELKAAVDAVYEHRDWLIRSADNYQDDPKARPILRPFAYEKIDLRRVEDVCKELKHRKLARKAAKLTKLL